jgi:hypothetical protein
MPAAEVEHVELTTLSQGNAGPPQVSLTPAGGGLGTAQPWGRSEPPHLDLDFELPLEPQAFKTEPVEPDSSEFKLLPREGSDPKDA